MSKIRAIEYNWRADQEGYSCFDEAIVNNALTEKEDYDLNQSSVKLIAREQFRKAQGYKNNPNDSSTLFENIIGDGLQELLGTIYTEEARFELRQQLTKKQFLTIFRRHFKEQLLNAEAYLKKIKNKQWSKEITKIKESERFCEIFYLNGKKEKVFNVNKIYYNDQKSRQTKRSQ